MTLGEDAHRTWADAQRYGFVSGGQGKWFSQTLKLLFPGSRVFVNIPRTGMSENAEDDELSEYVVRVEWIKTLPRSEAHWETGLFATQHTACRMRSRFTLERLRAHFGLEDRSTAERATLEHLWGSGSTVCTMGSGVKGSTTKTGDSTAVADPGDVRVGEPGLDLLEVPRVRAPALHSERRAACRLGLTLAERGHPSAGCGVPWIGIGPRTSRDGPVLQQDTSTEQRTPGAAGHHSVYSRESVRPAPRLPQSFPCLWASMC